MSPTLSALKATPSNRAAVPKFQYSSTVTLPSFFKVTHRLALHPKSLHDRLKEWPVG